mgnify:CR=1 FL=1
MSGESPQLYQTPCFFYLKGQQAQTVEKYVSIVDLPPTIANLFGLDVPYEYYAGRHLGQGGGIVDVPQQRLV